MNKFRYVDGSEGEKGNCYLFIGHNIIGYVRQPVADMVRDEIKRLEEEAEKLNICKTCLYQGVACSGCPHNICPCTQIGEGVAEAMNKASYAKGPASERKDNE